MGRYDFVSPGALAGNAIEEFFVKRQLEERQRLEDAFKRQQEARLAKASDAQIANTTAQTESLVDQRNAAIQQREEELFKKSHLPGDVGTAEDLKKFPGLMQPGQVTQGADLGVDEQGINQYEVKQTPPQYRGDAAQRQAQQQKDAIRNIIQQNPQLAEHPGIKVALQAAEASGEYSGLYGAIAQMTKGPTDDVKVGSFEDYVVRRYGANPKPQDIQQARKDYMQADDRPFAPRLIITPGVAPTLFNPNTQQVSSPTGPGGQALPTTPTAEQANRDSSMRRVAPFLEGVTELSARINTRHGAIAKGAGAYRRLLAKVNEDDDVAEYVSMVEAFTPLLARALGHTGVLTEPDYEHTIQVIPGPGDSQSLAGRKLARVEKILFPDAGTPAAPGAAPAGAPPANETPQQRRERLKAYTPPQR